MLIYIYNKTKSDNLYITLCDYSKLRKYIVDAKIKKKKLGTKDDITNFVKKTDFDCKPKNLSKKVTSNKTKTCRNWKEPH